MTDPELSAAAAQELRRASQRQAREVLAEAAALTSRRDGDEAPVTAEAIREAWAKMSAPPAAQPQRSGFSVFYAALAVAVVGGAFLAFELTPTGLTRIGGAALVLGAVALCYVLASLRGRRRLWGTRYRAARIPRRSGSLGPSSAARVQSAGEELPEAPPVVAVRKSSSATLDVLVRSIGAVTINVFVFGIVIWWLAVVLSKIGVAPVNSRGIIVDQYQRAKDILLVVFPLAAAAVGYWCGNYGKAKAEDQARQAQKKVTALLGSSDDGELLKKAAASFPSAFPELSRTRPTSPTNADEAR
jgi:hypothetical protein